MNQAPLPSADLTVLFNMLISAGLGLMGGLIGGWIAHMFAVSRDKQTRKWQELTYWRNLFERYLEEAQKIARVSGAIGYVYSDDDRDIAIYTLREQYAMRQARKARQRIQLLSKELGIDAGISRDDVQLQRLPVHFDS